MSQTVITYAIGDIHGRLDLLISLLEQIRTHAAGRLHNLVFLGDYIDRGPDSAGVIRSVMRLQAERPGDVVCLKGNHEAMMLDATDRPADEDAVAFWLMNGGVAALQSFGVSEVTDVPVDVREWARQLPTFHEDARRYYVHAGLDPRRPLHDQDDYTRIWIRDRFLHADHDFGKHIVHGHTPSIGDRPDAHRHCTNLDTGAVFGGALTAGVFTPEQDRAVAYLQAFTEAAS